MAGVKTDVEFSVGLDTGPAKKAANDMKKSLASVEKKGSQVFFSDKNRSKLTQFNEKTEKMRQITAATGLAMGGAAGQAIYYTGTISSMAGSFGALEIAALGITAIIATFGSIISAQKDDLESWRKGMDSAKKEVKRLNDEMERSNQSFYNNVLGISQQEQALKDMRTQLSLASQAFAEAREKSVEFADSWDHLQAKLAKDNVEAAKKEYDQLSAAVAEGERKLADRKAVERKVGNDKLFEGSLKESKRLFDAEKKAADALSKQREQEREREQEQKYQYQLNSLDQDVLAEERLIDERKKKAKEQQDLERQNDNDLLAWKRYVAEQQAEIDKEAADKKRESMLATIDMTEMFADNMMQFGDMFDLFGVQAAKTEEQREKAIAKRTLVESILGAGIAFAKAAGEWDNPYAAAAYIAQGTLFLAAAAKAASYGGGSAGGVSRGASSGRGDNGFGRQAQAPQQSTNVVNINGGIFGYDAGRAVTQLQTDYQQAQNPGRATGGF